MKTASHCPEGPSAGWLHLTADRLCPLKDSYDCLAALPPPQQAPLPQALPPQALTQQVPPPPQVPPPQQVPPPPQFPPPQQAPPPHVHSASADPSTSTNSYTASINTSLSPSWSSNKRASSSV